MRFFSLNGTKGEILDMMLFGISLSLDLSVDRYDFIEDFLFETEFLRLWKSIFLKDLMLNCGKAFINTALRFKGMYGGWKF